MKNVQTSLLEAFVDLRDLRGREREHKREELLPMRVRWIGHSGRISRLRRIMAASRSGAAW